MPLEMRVDAAEIPYRKIGVDTLKNKSRCSSPKMRISNNSGVDTLNNQGRCS